MGALWTDLYELKMAASCIRRRMAQQRSAPRSSSAAGTWLPRRHRAGGLPHVSWSRSASPLTSGRTCGTFTRSTMRRCKAHQLDDPLASTHPRSRQGPDITGDRAIRPYCLQAARGNVVIDPERSTAEPPEIASTDGASRDCINRRHVRDCINDRWPRSLRVVGVQRLSPPEHQRLTRREFINPARPPVSVSRP